MRRPNPREPPSAADRSLLITSGENPAKRSLVAYPSIRHSQREPLTTALPNSCSTSYALQHLQPVLRVDTQLTLWLVSIMIPVSFPAAGPCMRWMLVVCLGVALVAGCSSHDVRKTTSAQPTLASSNSNLPTGYPAATGELITWGTKLADVPGLTVVSQSGEAVNAIRGDVPDGTPVREMREVFTFKNDALLEVRVRQVTQFPEQELEQVTADFTEKYGQPVASGSVETMEGRKLVWQSPATRLTLRCGKWKTGIYQLTALWQRAV